MQKISCVIITKNEERNIDRCLNSIKDIADETIVIDSYSTDRTEEICIKYGVTFIQQAWLGYAATKNYGNSLAKYPYILSLDADEALSPELIVEIMQLKKSGNASDAYEISRLTNYCGKWIRHCGWYPDRKLRLWKNNLGKWEGLIHEEINLNVGIKPNTLKGDILHYSYYSINEHLHQMINFTDLMAEMIVEKHKKISPIKLIISPVTKFVVAYFIRGGFKDGFYGFVICVLSGYATFLKYAKSIHQQKQMNTDIKSNHL